MGNVNEREGGSPGGSVSVGLEEDEDEEPLSSSSAVDVDVDVDVTPSMPLFPTALHSPLIFAPQPPVAPIHRPDDLNPSWMPPSSPPSSHNSHSHAHAHAHSIPTMITWTHAANQVAVQGSWDNWTSTQPLQRSGKDFTLIKLLSSGVYHYTFFVDGLQTYAPDLPSSQDEAGNYYNILDLQEYVPEDTESISGFEPPQSPDCSYDNVELSQEDLGKEPPVVPPHLSMTLLNVPSLCVDTPPPLARPQHVVLNHLYMQRGNSGPSVVALGSTHRFKAKYVTVVLYKCL